jgi:hypothetical protein
MVLPGLLNSENKDVFLKNVLKDTALRKLFKQESNALFCFSEIPTTVHRRYVKEHCL